MSKLFEALNRGGDLLTEPERESLLEGQIPSELALPPAMTDGGSAAPIPKSSLFQGAVASARMLPLKVLPTSPILPFDGTHWGAGEQYRLLRTKIRQHPKAPHIVVVTSASPSDGKSVTAINLAGALALKGEARVLLMDGDFRRSTVCAQLGLPEEPGLAEVLSGSCALHEALIQTEQIPNLYILGSGRAVANPAELLDCSLWHALIEFSRAEFEYIIIDCPPYGCLVDYDLIQAVCDATILVIRPDYTDRRLCLNALAAIPKDKLIGVVMNCVEEWFLNKSQNAYYGYYDTRPEPRRTAVWQK